MKKFVALGVICSVLFAGDAFSARVSATATRGRAPATVSATNNVTPTPTTSARAAVTRGKVPSAGGTVTKAASGKSGGISARAATTQKVINSGTKIAGATTNTIVSEECKTKYYGCMDSFCMLDNANGGRCLCSNRNAELDKVLEEIQKLDEQSYAMATDGVERINMGESADAVNAMVEKVAGANKNKDTDKTQKKARKLNLDAWNTDISFADDVSNIFGNTNDLSDKQGDELHAAVSSLCFGQMQECSPEFSMLKMMYTQQIKSDCTAYENSLKQQRNASAKKLQTAQQAMREAALEQYQNQNKYDLGQCTIRFKECMQQTAGCGDDFSKCASIVATENAQNKVGTRKKQVVKTYKIDTGMTTVEIAAATYDTLTAKKPMCESVTKNCVAVKDKVWDAFLKEAAPEIKSAELIAESNVRMSCIGNISECFQKACKDNIDPNDPDGSYDLCLSRPDTMRSLCKVQIDPCVAAEPKILDYVYARLASMRVDACTNEVKSCLTDDNRCGKDYANCIGLDTDTIINMCPSEKLTACNVDSAGKTLSQKEVYANIENIIEGLMLNMDNSFLVQCQNAMNESMVKVCGDTENCDNLVVDDGAGKRSFKYEVCQYDSITAQDINWNGICRDSLDGIATQDLKLADGKGWAGKLSGTIYWGDIAYEEGADGKFALTNQDQYIEKLKAAGHKPTTEEIQIIHDRVFGTEIKQLESAINNAINAIESDPKVQFCMTGRQVQGLNDKMIGRAGKARFPNLTGQIRQIIAASAIKNARENYLKKYDEEIERMMEDQVKAAQKIDKDNLAKTAEKTCADWAENSKMPVSEAPKVSQAGKWIAVGLIAAVAVVATVFTFGAAGAVAIPVAMSTAGAIAGGAVAVGAAAAAATIATSASVAGSAVVDQWNYKANITTVFNSVSGECTKTTITQNCSKVKKNYCEKWGEQKETSKTIKLY